MPPRLPPTFVPDKASEAILALKPVTFRYKKEIDAERTPQFGLVAEQVEKVNPDLVAPDDGGKVYTVRYEVVNAMLLTEFLKEHRKNEEQGATIARQRKDFDAALAQQQQPGRYGLVAELYFLDEAGWSWGCIAAIDSNARTIWIADAHRDNSVSLCVPMKS